MQEIFGLDDIVTIVEENKTGVIIGFGNKSEVLEYRIDCNGEDFYCTSDELELFDKTKVIPTREFRDTEYDEPAFYYDELGLVWTLIGLRQLSNDSEQSVNIVARYNKETDTVEYRDMTNGKFKMVYDF